MNPLHNEWKDSQASQAAPPVTPRSCHELGVCNQRPGTGCVCDTRSLPAGGFVFAPGVIETEPRRAVSCRRPWRTAARWAWHVVSVVCVLIVLLGLWGMATGKGAAAPSKPATTGRLM